jgi:hypothetical protein
MKKTFLIVAAVAVLGVAAYLGAGALASSGADPAVANADQASAPGETEQAGSTADPNQPERTAEVKGVVLAINGTDLQIERYIKDPTEELTDEEKAAKKASRAEMTQEERQALKAAENAGLETERVTVSVPVGTPIVQMVLDGDTPVAEPSSLADIRGGMEITVWTDGATDGGTAQYVKLASAK